MSAVVSCTEAPTGIDPASRTDRTSDRKPWMARRYDSSVIAHRRCAVGRGPRHIEISRHEVDGRQSVDMVDAPYADRVTCPRVRWASSRCPRRSVSDGAGEQQHRYALGHRDLVAELDGRADHGEAVACGRATQDHDISRQCTRQAVQHQLRVNGEAFHQREQSVARAGCPPGPARSPPGRPRPRPGRCSFPIPR